MKLLNLNKAVIAATGTLLLSGLTGVDAVAHSNKDKSTTIPGYVVHGINTYNGKPIGDYSKVAPNVAMINVDPAIEEIGFFQEGSSVSGTITESTDRNLPVATTRSFFDFFNPTGEIDPATVNIPLGQVGSNFFGSSAADDRVVPTEYPAPGTGPIIHRAKHTVANPTVGDWEKISGSLTVTKKRDGSAIVKVTVRDAFPNSLYTLWDVGTSFPLSENEAGYAVPLGGLPNVLMTDKNGCGYKKIKISYDLLRDCEAGAESCTSYISAFYHWDGQAYGASPAATWFNAPTGIYAGNQLAWPTSGEVLIEPQTTFSPKRHGCK
ncbi:MAG: hypothetical protein COA42_12460 [Alteromonadaceae bacterium]|nr:MAG: hypothetical protein COA42_12460 [Alteromonadaceae bacterium]